VGWTWSADAAGPTHPPRSRGIPTGGRWPAVPSLSPSRPAPLAESVSIPGATRREQPARAPSLIGKIAAHCSRLPRPPGTRLLVCVSATRLPARSSASPTRRPPSARAVVIDRSPLEAHARASAAEAPETDRGFGADSVCAATGLAQQRLEGWHQSRQHKRGRKPGSSSCQVDPGHAPAPDDPPPVARDRLRLPARGTTSFFGGGFGHASRAIGRRKCGYRCKHACRLDVWHATMSGEIPDLEGLSPMPRRPHVAPSARFCTLPTTRL